MGSAHERGYFRCVSLLCKRKRHDSTWHALHLLVAAPVFIPEVAAAMIFAGRTAYALAKHVAEVVQVPKAALGGGFTHRLLSSSASMVSTAQFLSALMRRRP